MLTLAMIIFGGEHGQVLSVFESSGALPSVGLTGLFRRAYNISVTSCDIGITRWSDSKAAQS